MVKKKELTENLKGLGRVKFYFGKSNHTQPTEPKAILRPKERVAGLIPRESFEANLPFSDGKVPASDDPNIGIELKGCSPQSIKIMFASV